MRKNNEVSVDRITRVNEILKREIADLLQRQSFSEKFGALVSVTRVECSTTLKQADVYVSMFGIEAGSDREQEILSALVRLKSDIQRRMSKHVILKYTPVLRFLADHNLAEGDRVLQLLRELEGDEENESC